MAKFEDRDISEFPQHNNGSMRVYKWKGKVCIATIAQKRRRTTSQKEAIQKIGLLNHFNGTVYAFINIGLASSGSRPSARVFRLNYRSAFKGEYPNIELDYPSLSLSEGPLPLPSNLSASPAKDNAISISWLCDGIDNPDHVLMVLLFNPSFDQAVVYTKAARRSDEKALISIPPKWKNQNFHVYAAFHDKDLATASNSAYLGSMILDFTSTRRFDSSHLFKPRVAKPAKKKEPKNFDITGISGSVGPLVFFTNNFNEVIVTSAHRGNSKPQTLKSRMYVERFKVIAHFISPFQPFIKIGYAAHNNHTLPRSVAMSRNLKYAVIGDYPDYRVDYLAVQLSEGPLVPPQQIVTHLENNKLTVSWSSQSADSSDNDFVTILDHSSSSPDDYLILALYNPSTEETILSLNEFTRKDGTAIISIPKSWKSANPCIAYLAFHNGNPIAPLSSPTAAIIISSPPCGGRCRRL